MFRRLEVEAASIRSTDRRTASRLGWLAYFLAFGIPIISILTSLVIGSLPWSLIRVFGLLKLTGVILLAGALFIVRRPGVPGRVAIEGPRLSWKTKRGERALDTSTLVSGITIPHDGEGLVELVTSRGETIELQLSSVSSAERFVETLGFNEERRVTIVRVGTRYPASIVVTAMSAIGLFGAVAMAREVFLLLGALAANLAMVGAVGAIGLVAAWFWSSTDVVVGRDGVRLKHFFTRFIPHDDIARVSVVEQDDDRVRLLLRDGGSVAVHPLATDQVERMRALASYVERAMVVDEGPAMAAINALDRGDEPIPSWRQRLRHVFALEPGYRGPRLHADDAMTVLSDPSRSAERRLGAALALAETGRLDDGARQRLRVAAEQSANPKMRVAFEGIAAGEIEDAAVEEALASSTPRSARAG